MIELRTLRQLQSIEPREQWLVQTRAMILEKFEQTEHGQGRPESFFPSFVVMRKSFVLVPVFAVLFGFLLVRSIDERSVSVSVPLAVEPQSRTFPELPLAKSVQNPTEPRLLAVQPLAKVPARAIPKRRRSPVARTRLARSVQSVPDARWVFGEQIPAEHSRWVFSQPSDGQSNGS